jgi:hypothetical protein
LAGRFWPWRGGFDGDGIRRAQARVECVLDLFGERFIAFGAGNLRARTHYFDAQLHEVHRCPGQLLRLELGRAFVEPVSELIERALTRAQQLRANSLLQLLQFSALAHHRHNCVHRVPAHLERLGHAIDGVAELQCAANGHTQVLIRCERLRLVLVMPHHELGHGWIVRVIREQLGLSNHCRFNSQ